MATQKNSNVRSARSAQIVAAAAKLRQDAPKRQSPRLHVESGVGDTRPEWYKVHPDADNKPTKGAPSGRARSVRK
eukprot:62210-Prorocentrum_minimum.AAC.1